MLAINPAGLMGRENLAQFGAVQKAHRIKMRWGQ